MSMCTTASRLLTRNFRDLNSTNHNTTNVKTLVYWPSVRLCSNKKGHTIAWAYHLLVGDSLNTLTLDLRRQGALKGRNCQGSQNQGRRPLEVSICSTTSAQDLTHGTTWCSVMAATSGTCMHNYEESSS